MAYVYVLKDESTGKYYVGSTIDINRRFGEHVRKSVKSTKHFKALKLVGCKKYFDINKARWEERLLKRSAWRRKKFINLLEFERSSCSSTD